ncbi:ribonuclease HII [Ruminococcaceae bacterium OttesenSCG-928-L11]|nr:ribonuclease HII [Ruminococcaceae bacterium OttesenSCG-928-L11]
MNELTLFDHAIRSDGYAHICGVDEAGRGPLAGPVFAAAVILPDGMELDGVRDSKKLSAKKRDVLYDSIKANALAWCIASASVEEIDALNILEATMLAMERAVNGLSIRPDCALIDGNRLPALSMDTLSVIGGDDKSASIAAASILAKVERDRLLLELDRQYPAYQFARHKGYGTKLHYEMLDAHGVSPVHRESFLRKWRAKAAGAR